MPTKTTDGHETTSKKKSLFGSFTDRRSRRSLVYNLREAESSSEYSVSIDPVEEKLDKLSDDLHSLQNTLRAVAHRVQDLEKVISEKQMAVQSVQELSTAGDQQQMVRVQVHEEKRSSELSLRQRNPARHDVNQSRISDKLKSRPAPQPPQPESPAIQIVQTETLVTKPKHSQRRHHYDLDSVMKHELYRTVPKIIVDCCNLIEDHATIVPFDRVYFLTGDWDEIRTVLKSYVDERNYNKCLENVKSMHTLANIVKLFLQELRYPVISISEVQAFLGTNMARWESASNSEKVDAMQKLMKSLPEVNRDTMKYFVRHLRRLCRDYPKKVRSQELAVSIMPCVFQTFRQKPKTSQENLRDEYLITYLQFMIDQCESIFKINQRTKFRKTLERCISCPGLFNL